MQTECKIRFQLLHGIDLIKIIVDFNFLFRFRFCIWFLLFLKFFLTRIRDAYVMTEDI